MTSKELPSRVISKPEIVGVQDGHLCWESAEYYGSLRSFRSGFPMGGGPYKVIGITAIDDTARHDWREFQQLKNYLVGEEWEGLELYPAESRLVDPSNRFYLWCVPKGVITWGLPGNRRHVCDAEDAIAPQRPLPRRGAMEAA